MKFSLTLVFTICLTTSYLFSSELLASLTQDLADLKPAFAELGDKLKVPPHVIEQLKMDSNQDSQDSGNILSKIIEYWISNTSEDQMFHILYTALETIRRRDLANAVKEKYMQPSKGILAYLYKDMFNLIYALG